MKTVCFGPAVLLCFLLALPASAAERKKTRDADSSKAKAASKFRLTDPIEVKLEEDSVFAEADGSGAYRSAYPRGQSAYCSTQRAGAARKYPKLNSQQPLYGTVYLGSNYLEQRMGKRFAFVLDQSEANPPAEEKKAEKGSAKKAAKANYDRLYFDLNGDGDLTNDPVIKRADKLPPGVARIDGAAAFEEFTVDKVGDNQQPVALVMLLMSRDGRDYRATFIAAKGRRGTLHLGDQDWTVKLRQVSGIGGSFADPYVQVEMSHPTEPYGSAPLPIAGMLGEIRRIGEQYVTLKATVKGDRLTIAPYRGDLGILEVKAGGRAITKMGITGSLASKQGVVNLGDRYADADLPRRIEVPVGDYRPMNLTVVYGRLRFSCRELREDYSTGKTPTYTVQIRKDKPFVLEFAGKPNVVFSGPREAEFKPGQTVAFRAMLTEPERGIMITGLEDLDKSGREYTITDGQRVITRREYQSLDPKIEIVNAKGKVVCSGRMPFG